MADNANFIKLDNTNVPEFKSLDEYINRLRTSSPINEQVEAEGKIVTYITESQLLQLLKQRAIIVKPKT